MSDFPRRAPSSVRPTAYRLLPAASVRRATCRRRWRATASLAIRERLAKADPGNAGWQRDLALSHGRVAMVAVRLGQREAALRGLRQGRTIIARLVDLSRDNATLPKDLAWFDSHIAALERR